MIKTPALFNLTRSRTLRLLLKLTTLIGLATIVLFTPSFFFIELSYFIRNVFIVVLAITNTVKGPSIFT